LKQKQDVEMNLKNEIEQLMLKRMEEAKTGIKSDQLREEFEKKKFQSLQKERDLLKSDLETQSKTIQTNSTDLTNLLNQNQSLKSNYELLENRFQDEKSLFQFQLQTSNQNHDNLKKQLEDKKPIFITI